MRSALFLILFSFFVRAEDFVAPNFEKIINKSLSPVQAKQVLQNDIAKKYSERLEADKAWTTYVSDAFKNNKPVCSKDSNLDGYACFKRVFQERQKIQPLTIAGLVQIIPAGMNAINAKFIRDKQPNDPEVRQKEASALVDLLEVLVLCREEFPHRVKPSDIVKRTIAGTPPEAEKLLKSGDIPAAGDLYTELADKVSYDVSVQYFAKKSGEIMVKVAAQTRNMTPDTKRRFFKLAEKLQTLNSK